MITKRQTAVDPNNFDPNDVVVVGSDGVVQGGGVTGVSDVRNDYWNPAVSFRRGRYLFRFC